MANEKILVVDDDTNICELLRLYLTKEGYQVTTANDGEEGLEKFNQLKPDMVLLDVMMPYFRDLYGNPSSMHTFGGQVGQRIRTAREQVAALMEARAKVEIEVTAVIPD